MPGFGGKPIAAAQSAFAIARYGSGADMFLGDVNAESSTLARIAIIDKGEPRRKTAYATKKQVTNHA